MQRRDDSSLPSHSHSSMNNNIWYGADDAPGVIDVDISSSVAMLDYSYYNDNSAEYTSDGSGGKIEYVYVHDDDDIRDGITSNYRLDADEGEEEEGACCGCSSGEAEAEAPELPASDGSSNLWKRPAR